MLYIYLNSIAANQIIRYFCSKSLRWKSRDFPFPPINRRSSMAGLRQSVMLTEEQRKELAENFKTVNNPYIFFYTLLSHKNTLRVYFRQTLCQSLYIYFRLVGFISVLLSGIAPLQVPLLQVAFSSNGGHSLKNISDLQCLGHRAPRFYCSKSIFPERSCVLYLCCRFRTLQLRTPVYFWIDLINNFVKIGD